MNAIADLVALGAGTLLFCTLLLILMTYIADSLRKEDEEVPNTISTMEARRIRRGIKAAHCWASLMEQSRYDEAARLDLAFDQSHSVASRIAYARTRARLVREAFQARRQRLATQWEAALHQTIPE